VASWGANPVVSELTPGSERRFGLTFPNGEFSYRAFPVPFGTVSREALRDGMDVMNPRGP
jgi:hypothetical protein